MAWTEYLDTVQKLYIAYYQRPADPEGLVYWAKRLDDAGGSLEGIIEAFANSPESQALYGEINESNIAEVVKAIYNAAFNRDPEAEGLNYYVEGFKSGKFTPATIMLDILNGAKGDDAIVLENKLISAMNFTKVLDPELDGKNLLAKYDAEDIPAAREFLKKVGLSSDSVKTYEEAKEYIQLKIADPDDPINHYTLTAETDNAMAHVFDAPMVYTPAGDDRVMSLQDEDILKGLPTTDDNVLNAVIGHTNPNETATVRTVTPTLQNIQKLNLEWTGDVTTLDLRYADSVKEINVNKVTQDATAVRIQNISTPATDVSISNIASPNVSVTLSYQDRVFDGTADTLNLKLSNVLANSFTQTSSPSAAKGFTNVNLEASDGVSLNSFSVNQMENLTIKGDGDFKIVNFLPVTNSSGVVEGYNLSAGAITNPNAPGLYKIDASQFSGDLAIDISKVLGGFVDPKNSGQKVHGQVIGGSGNDTFYAGKNVTATSSDNHDVIDGGAGNNTLVFAASSINGDAEVKNVQTLELKSQTFGTTAQTVDFNAFDDSIQKVIMRDELADSTAETFTLDNLSAKVAEDGLVLKHSVTETIAPTAPNAIVNAFLKDASGNNDTVAITVENDLNTTTRFNYTLNFAGQTMPTGARERVENVVINDNDSEDNVVTLAATDAAGNSAHTGKITLTGGTPGTKFEITTSLVASKIDASKQKSDLVLTVGETTPTKPYISQDIKLGSGNDLLVFKNADDFDSTDTVADAGGVDTVRAFYDKIKQAAPEFSGIERFETAVANNTILDLSKTDIENLILLSDAAANAVGVTGVQTTDTLTVKNSKLTSITFSPEATATLVPYPSVLKFNGVKLDNVATDSFVVTVDNTENPSAPGTFAAVNVGQLTMPQIKDLTLEVNTKGTTTINNIYASDLEEFKFTPTEAAVAIGTVSGNATNNNLKLFDASQVNGGLAATVISLGDNAKVTLGSGNDVFSALGSAGKNITIDAGAGDNIITGSAQSDTIKTYAGDDLISADRGDNVVYAGAGNDIVLAKDGNDTVNLGSGYLDVYADNLGTGLDGTQSTNTVILEGGVGLVQIDVDGSLTTGVEIDQVLAVGEGSRLTMSWTGKTLQAASSVLDGYSAQQDPTSPATDDNSNFVILTAAAPAVTAFDGKGGNDVVIVTNASKAVNFVGGEGNDAMVGGGDNDLFDGGKGKDIAVLQNTLYVENNRAALLGSSDGKVDIVKINDGDSTINGWDRVIGFDTTSGAGSTTVAAGSSTAGSDVLDLPGTPVIAAATAGTVAGVRPVGEIASYSIGANGLVKFFDNTGAAVTITSANLQDALTFLSENITAPGETVAFVCDNNGDGILDQYDSTFVFENGIYDNVVEFEGIYNGVEAVGGGTAGLIEIA